MIIKDGGTNYEILVREVYKCRCCDKYIKEEDHQENGMVQSR